MVSIGNFRSQQLTLGATNRNTGILKTNLQVSTGNTKFKPTGKTTLQPLVQITPGKCESKEDDKSVGRFPGDLNRKVPQDILDAKNSILGDKEASKRHWQREYEKELKEKLETPRVELPPLPENF